MGRGLPLGYRMKTDEQMRSRYRKLYGQPYHRYLAEQRTGLKLPSTAHVHHFDPADKKACNGVLVVCQDASYHLMIEARTRALLACGNANWKKCRECGKYADPAGLRVRMAKGRRANPITEYKHIVSCYRDSRTPMYAKVRANDVEA